MTLSPDNPDYYKSQSIHHSFSIEYATLFQSSDMAIFLHHIEYWLRYNSSMKKNWKEGRYWTYQTFEDMHGHFPYWTVKQLRLIVSKLMKMGILIKGNFNKNTFDRTSWYSIDYEKLNNELKNSHCDVPKRANAAPIRANGSAQKGEPIPNNIYNNKTTSICADSVDAPKPKISRKKISQENKISRRKHVFTSKEEHDVLLSKYGEELLNKCYDHLEEWKASKKETEPKVLEKHTDFYRIKKWVKSAVEEEKTSSKGKGDVLKESYKEKVKNYLDSVDMKGHAMDIFDDYVCFYHGTSQAKFKYCEGGFWDKLKLFCEKNGIRPRIPFN